MARLGELFQVVMRPKPGHVLDAGSVGIRCGCSPTQGRTLVTDLWTLAKPHGDPRKNRKRNGPLVAV
jgi:hypothetical protein